MDIEDVILFVAVIALVVFLGAWRTGVIGLSKKGIDYGLQQTKKSAENVQSITSKTTVSKGSYLITISNPKPNQHYETTDPSTGIKLFVVVNSQLKYEVGVVGVRNDIHQITIELPEGCKYYYEEYLIDSVSVKGTSWGRTLNTKVKLTFLYRVLGNDVTVIVLMKPYIDFSS